MSNLVDEVTNNIIQIRLEKLQEVGDQLQGLIADLHTLLKIPTKED